MRNIALSASLVVSLLACATAHIHSQKVARIQRDKVSVQTWLLALVSSLLLAGCGVFPLLLSRCLRLQHSHNHRQQGPAALRLVLSFAVGGLLGDVFLHLLPEAWGPPGGAKAAGVERETGMWVLAGVLVFLVVEKVAKCSESRGLGPGAGEGGVCQGEKSSSGSVQKNGFMQHPATNDLLDHVHCSSLGPGFGVRVHERVRGYLNLCANCTDNFTHGLAIAAGYVAGPTVGLLTTLAILCHEVPHEIGDFAILLNSGFGVWSAARAQAATATGGVVGVVAGLTAEHLSPSSSWLLPFTAGGFLYIAMVSIIPQLLQEDNWSHSIYQLAGLLLGVGVMAMVTIVEIKSCEHLEY